MRITLYIAFIFLISIFEKNAFADNAKSACDVVIENGIFIKDLNTTIRFSSLGNDHYTISEGSKGGKRYSITKSNESFSASYNYDCVPEEDMDILIVGHSVLIDNMAIRNSHDKKIDYILYNLDNHKRTELTIPRDVNSELERDKKTYKLGPHQVVVSSFLIPREGGYVNKSLHMIDLLPAPSAEFIKLTDNLRHVNFKFKPFDITANSAVIFREEKDNSLKTYSALTKKLSVISSDLGYDRKNYDETDQNTKIFGYNAVTDQVIYSTRESVGKFSLHSSDVDGTNQIHIFDNIVNDNNCSNEHNGPLGNLGCLAFIIKPFIACETRPLVVAFFEESHGIGVRSFDLKTGKTEVLREASKGYSSFGGKLDAFCK